MKRNDQQWWFATAVVLRACAVGVGVVIALAGCSSTPDPEFVGDWAISQPPTRKAPTSATACKTVSQTLPTSPSFTVAPSAAADQLELTIHDVSFRCTQPVCGYVQDFGELVRVLVQPCDLHPSTVTKCSCAYDIALSFPARVPVPTANVYLRQDFYGATDSNPPRFIGSTDPGAPCAPIPCPSGRTWTADTCSCA